MYDLVGINGNAFNVMGYVLTAMKEQGFSKKEQEAYTDAAMSGDYDHLICVSMDMVEQCNKRAEA